MTRYNYICWSTSGFVQRGKGETNQPLYSEDLTLRILNEVAENIQNLKIPWNPFNIQLVVKAQLEPEPVDTDHFYFL